MNGGYRVDRGGRAGNTSYSCRGAARDRSSQSGSSVPGFRSVMVLEAVGFTIMRMERGVLGGYGGHGCGVVM